MKQRILVSALGVGALAVAGLTSQGAAAAPTPYTAGKHAAQVCTTAKAAHTASCHALKLVDAAGKSVTSASPPATGLTPTGLRDASHDQRALSVDCFLIERRWWPSLGSMMLLRVL